MKKKILNSLIIVTLLSSMLLMLAACGKDDKESEQNKESEAQQTVRSFVENMGATNFDEAFKCVDWTAYALLTSENSHDLKQIDSEYDKLVEENKNDLEGLQDIINYIAAAFHDSTSKCKVFEVKITDIKPEQKVEDTQNIYEVEAKVLTKIQADEQEETKENETTCKFIVMKIADKWYVINGFDDILNNLVL